MTKPSANHHKSRDICIVFPFLKETEKAILIRVPQIAGSGYDIFATGREKEVWIPKSQMKEAGNGYYLKPWIWEKIAPSTALTTAAWVMVQMGADLETTGFPGEMLGEVASKVREAYPEPVLPVFLPGDRVRPRSARSTRSRRRDCDGRRRTDMLER